MTHPRGGGAFHHYLKMEMSTGEYGSYSREVMLHVLSQIEDLVPEADRRETLAMLFGPSHPLKLTYDGRRPSKASQASRRAT